RRAADRVGAAAGRDRLADVELVRRGAGVRIAVVAADVAAPPEADAPLLAGVLDAVAVAGEDRLLVGGAAAVDADEARRARVARSAALDAVLLHADVVAAALRVARAGAG